MRYIDQHMHSIFSFDSEADMEAYLRLTDNHVVTTEHLDLEDPSYDNKDRPLDLEAYVRTVNTLNDKYFGRMLKGIEVGWSAKTHKRILDVLKRIDFDLVLLSIHNSGTFDYMDQTAVIDKRPEVLIPQYIDNLSEGLEAMHESVQVLTHFDYGFRIHAIDAEDLKKHGEDKLIQLFRQMIRYDISFEVNTGSMFRYGNAELYRYAIPLYIACGGDNFTLGSDAHFVKDYQRRFKDAVLLLEGFGVQKLTYYIQQKAHHVLIDALLGD